MPPRSKHFYVMGLDLGQQADYTALAIAERLDVETAATEPDPDTVVVTADQRLRSGTKLRKETHYHLRHLERLPLGTAYPAVVARVCELLSQSPLREDPRLAVDATGVGLP